MSTKLEYGNRLIEKIQSYFSDENDVVAVYLFGSYAQGKARRTSDVDIGIFEKKQIRYLKELGRLLRKDIHPVILNTAGETLMQTGFIKNLIADPMVG